MGRLTEDDLAVYKVTLFDDAGLPTITQEVTAAYPSEDPKMPRYTVFKDEHHKMIHYVVTSRVSAIERVVAPKSETTGLPA